MRVIIVDRSIGNGYTLGLATGLEACGVDVCIWGPHPGDGDDSAGVVKAVLPRAGIRRRWVSKMLDTGVGGVRALHDLTTAGVDVIHAQWPTQLDFSYATVARHACGAKVVFTAHNPQRRWSERAPRLQQRLIRMADAVITHGPALREAVVSTGGVSEARVHALDVGNYEHVITRYPRDDARRRLGLPMDVPVFVFMGQIRARKGVDLLIDSFSRYVAGGGNGVLLIAGAETQGGYLAELRGRAQGLESRTRWMTAARPLAREQLDLAVSAASAVVLPFHDASQSASVIYAMTHGRYVITTDVGEVRRVVQGHGKVLPAHDTDGLSQALQEAELCGAQCDAVGHSAREYALAALSWDVIGRETADIYRSIVRRK